MKQIGNKSRNLFTIMFIVAGIISSAIYFSCATKNKCLNVVCKNGVCNQGSCTCDSGYFGAFCDSMCRDKWISAYNGGDSCNGPDDVDSFGHRTYNSQNPLRLTARIMYPKELLMTNFLNNTADSAVCTMVSCDSFSFVGANNSTSYTGSGFFRHDSLFMHYHVIHDTTSYYCNYVGVRY